MTAKKKNAVPFVVAYGGEDHLLDLTIEKAKTWANRAISLYDGEDMTDAEFVSLCEQPCMDGDQVIILDNANKLKGDKALALYVKDRSKDDTSVIVVAVLRTEKLSSTWESASNKGHLRHFPKFKPWQDDKICDRITEESDRLRLKLDLDVPPLFLRLLGDDLRAISRELQKMTLLVGEGGRVTRQDVMAVIAPNVPAEPYEVAEVATAKDWKAALRLVSVLFQNLGDGAAVPVTASLMKQVERLLIARQMLDKGDSVELIATRLETHKFIVQKNVLPRARRFTVPELRDQMRKLCRLETQVKGAARSKRTLVELAVLSVAS